MPNSGSIGMDCGIDSKTVRQYFQILVGTVVVVLVEPFARRRSRAVITREPGFHLFDVGAADHPLGRSVERAPGQGFGRALEHLFLMVLLAFRTCEERQPSHAPLANEVGTGCDIVVGTDEGTAI